VAERTGLLNPSVPFPLGSAASAFVCLLPPTVPCLGLNPASSRPTCLSHCLRCGTRLLSSTSEADKPIGVQGGQLSSEAEVAELLRTLRPEDYDGFTKEDWIH
jgi:hypothetical protein